MRAPPVYQNTNGHSARPIERATRWLVAAKEPPHPIVPHLRKTFRLSTVDAIHAIRRANDLRRLP